MSIIITTLPKGTPQMCSFAFDPMRQTAAAQKKQFGYNNDYMAFLPLPRGAASSDHGLLVVNHEYTNEELMFPGLGRQDPERSQLYRQRGGSQAAPSPAHRCPQGLPRAGHG